MEIQPLLAGKRIAGVRQTLKAVNNNSVSVVYIASDADTKVIEPLREACLHHGVRVAEADTGAKLGKSAVWLSVRPPAPF